jgi:hypothetical protein
MLLEACAHLDLELTNRLEPAFEDSRAWMQRRRRWLAGVTLGASVLDLVLTQTILTLVAARSGVQPAEANPFMAPLVMSWWAWPLRVGVPALAVLRDLHARNYGLITTAAALYGAVVVWNLCLWLTL